MTEYEAPCAETIDLRMEHPVTGTVGGDTPPYQEEEGE